MARCDQRYSMRWQAGRKSLGVTIPGQFFLHHPDNHTRDDGLGKKYKNVVFHSRSRINS